MLRGTWYVPGDGGQRLWLPGWRLGEDEEDECGVSLEAPTRTSAAITQLPPHSPPALPPHCLSAFCPLSLSPPQRGLFVVSSSALLNNSEPAGTDSGLNPKTGGRERDEEEGGGQRRFFFYPTNIARRCGGVRGFTTVNLTLLSTVLVDSSVSRTGQSQK